MSKKNEGIRKLQRLTRLIAGGLIIQFHMI